MKAIQNKYLPFTNTKPSRIVAKAEGVRPLTLTCSALDEWRTENKLEHITNHQAAARLLAVRNNWSTVFCSGRLPEGIWTHCFVPETVVETLKLGKILFDVVSCSERFVPLADGVNSSIKSLNI